MRVERKKKEEDCPLLQTIVRDGGVLGVKSAFRVMNSKAKGIATSASSKGSHSLQ